MTDIALRDASKTLQGVILTQLVSDVTSRYNDLGSNFKESWDETITFRYQTLKSIMAAPFKEKKSVEDEEDLYPDLTHANNPSVHDKYKPIEKLTKVRRTNIYAPMEKQFTCTACNII